MRLNKEWDKMGEEQRTKYVGELKRPHLITPDHPYAPYLKGSKPNFQNRPTNLEHLRENKTTILSNLFGTNAKLKHQGPILYEKLQSFYRLPGNHGTPPKEEMIQALQLSGFCKSEDDENVYIKMGPYIASAPYHKHQTQIFDLKNMTYENQSTSTDPQSDYYCDYKSKGKEILGEIASELRGEMDKVAPGKAKEIDAQIQAHAKKMVEDRDNRKYENLDPKAYLGPTMFYDKLQEMVKSGVAEKLGKVRGEDLFKISGTTHAIAIIPHGMSHVEGKNGIMIMRLQGFKGYKTEGIMPSNKENLQKVLGGKVSYEEVKEKYIIDLKSRG